MSQTTKGVHHRKMSVTQEEYDTRWDAIFAKDIPPLKKECCGKCDSSCNKHANDPVHATVAMPKSTK